MESPAQHETDLLLGAASSARTNVQAYDFRRPHRVSKERLRTLEAMYERMVKTLEGWLISRVRGAVELRLRSVDQSSFGEFTQSLPSPSATYIFDVEGAGGAQGAVDIGADLAYYLVDRLFGGGGQATVPQRALSPVERMALRTVAERTCQLLEEIWQDHVPLSVGVSGFESSPEILQIARREDPALVACFEVQVGQSQSHVLVCLPLGVLEKFFQSAAPRRVGGTAGGDRERSATRERAERALRATPVDISARLPDFKLSLRELAVLTPGQVLATGVPRDADLVVRVGGSPRYTGSAGRIGRRLAVRLEDSVGSDATPGGDAPVA